MADRNLILTLAKVIIAAAWADGEITQDEKNSLKDLLFHLPRGGYKQDTRVSGREWAELEIYMDAPVDAAERARLVKQLQAALGRPKDRELALAALENILHADGDISAEEQAVMEEIKTALNEVDLGIFAQFGRLVQGPVQRRSAAVAGAPNREEYLEDFIRNKVYYAVRQRLGKPEEELDIAETELRKLSLAGGLMARIAHVDRVVTQEEFDIMVAALQNGWEVSQDAATFVAEVAVSEVGADLDYYRLTREFTTSTIQKERVRFLDVLFAVAAADGELSHQETEEIRGVARSLNLSHRQFINAKVKALRNG